MQPFVKKYLENHSFQDLENEHGICSRVSSDRSKISLNYDQIMVKNGDIVAEQCRGMVIRPTHVDMHGDNWKHEVVGHVDVLAWPMNRFYNYGDPVADEINWSDPDVRIYEKLDGTMIIVYWDELQQRWCAATRSVPEADLPIYNDHIEIGNMTFSGLFLKALQETREAIDGISLNDKSSKFDDIIVLNKQFTYVFELTTPYNRIVVKYDVPRVTLLAVRHTSEGYELPIESLKMRHVNMPKTWNLCSIESLVAFVDSANPANLEGAVICDSLFNRIKVKNKSWVLSSRAKNLVTVSKRSALLAIITGTIDDVLPLIEDEIANELRKMQVTLKSYLRQIDLNFATFRANSQESRKNFALMVAEHGDWQAPYFNMWEKRSTSALEYVELAAKKEKLSNSTLDIILKKMNELTI